MNRPIANWGMRQRVSATFGLGALMVSVFVAVATYTVAANHLWIQRAGATLRETAFNARAVDSAVGTERPALDALLGRIDESAESSAPLVRWRGKWYDERFAPGVAALPDSFVAAAEDGQAVRQRVAMPSGPVVVTAVPVDEGSYVQVFSLRALDQTLRTLGTVFAITTTVATALGVLLGRWASRRALRPLAAVTAAAGAIAEGDLEARLGVQPDRDLAAIARAFDRTASRLQARVKRDARFAADVSHELRSPLTTMVNAVDLLRTRSERFDEESQEILSLLADDVHRFAAMVEDLLEISLIENAPARQHRLVSVRDCVRMVTERVVGRSVDLTAPASDPMVSIDPRRLEQIVENLLHNAEKHGGGVRAVLVEDAGPAVRVAVEDAGPGVPLQDRERIFERFARGSGSTHSSGTGLGLALVTEHVRAQGGRVWVEEAPKGGARFVVQLPRGAR